MTSERTAVNDVHDRTTTTQIDRPLSVASSVETVRRTLPTIKLGTYDGSTVLETFLAKFENSAAYYSWSKRDRLFHLKASLEGHAGHVLWEITSDATESDIVKLLRNRFGNTNQMERFRAELRTRRRKSGESVQSVYQDIRRLMALGFTGQAGDTCEIIARDFFLDALADPSLRIRVMDQRPTPLDDALAIVSRMEAYSNTSSSSPEDNESHRRKICGVNVTSPPSDQPSVSLYDDRRL